MQIDLHGLGELGVRDVLEAPRIGAPGAVDEHARHATLGDQRLHRPHDLLVIGHVELPPGNRLARTPAGGAHRFGGVLERLAAAGEDGDVGAEPRDALRNGQPDAERAADHVHLRIVELSGFHTALPCPPSFPLAACDRKYTRTDTAAATALPALLDHTRRAQRGAQVFDAPPIDTPVGVAGARG